jgi:hypothetical protein
MAVKKKAASKKKVAKIKPLKPMTLSQAISVYKATRGAMPVSRKNCIESRGWIYLRDKNGDALAQYGSKSHKRIVRKKK